MSNNNRENFSYRTSIDIPKGARSKIIEILNLSLAESLDLYSQTKQSHWNVKGNNFYSLHKLYDEMAEGVLEWVDLIAERVTALGGYAEGTVRMTTNKSDLPEHARSNGKSDGFVSYMVEKYAIFAGKTRKRIMETVELGDPTTSDLFTEISRKADKYLWFLEAHLQ